MYCYSSKDLISVHSLCCVSLIPLFLLNLGRGNIVPSVWDIIKNRKQKHQLDKCQRVSFVANVFG